MIGQKILQLSIKRQTELLLVNRSSVYYKSKNTVSCDVKAMNEIQDLYTTRPYYGYRRMEIELRRSGVVINHKKVHRLMQLAGLKAIYPSKKTSIGNRNHHKYPYLLKDLSIAKPNQVWAVDITYVRMKKGFLYLICLIDLFSRKIMGWALSTFLDTKSCLEALQNALKYGIPEIINSDQGCQFTSDEWVTFLINKGIKISMDGKGRWADNIWIERLWRTIKYEAVYLQSFDSVGQAREKHRRIY